MTSLYIDRRDVELRSDGGAIAFYENNERVGTVPIAPLQRVFLRGNAFIETSLLGKLGQNGTGVIILSGRKAEPSLLLAQPHNDARRRVAQFQLSLDSAFALTFSKCVVTCKLQAQRDVLIEELEKRTLYRYVLSRRIKELENALTKIDTQTSIASLRGLEGSAAASYFAAFSEFLPKSLNFSCRNRRPPKDPLNVVLSLGYTLLLSEASLALYGAGLDPYIGFYHKLNFGRESLSCDVIEPLRPIIDRFALDAFRKKDLRTEDFSMTQQSCLIGKAGRSRFYSLYESVAETIRKKLTESIRDINDVIKNVPIHAEFDNNIEDSCDFENPFSNNNVEI